MVSSFHFQISFNNKGHAMKRFVWHCLAAAVCCAMSPAAMAAINFNLDAIYARGEWNTYNTEPTLFLPDSAYSTATIHAPAGMTTATGIRNPDGGGNSSSQYAPYADFAQWKADMNGTWTLTVDPGLPTAKDYTFTVAFNLNASDFPAFGFTAPSWNQVVDPMATLSTYGPAAEFQKSSWYMYRLPNYNLIMAEWIPAGATTKSWTPTPPLEPGDYALYNSYNPALPSGSIVISAAVDSLGNALDEWNPTASMHEYDAVNFSVAVPEPGTLLLLAAGGCLLLRRRRHGSR
jgi:hypothetical protein